MSLAAILLVVASALLLTFRDYQTKKSLDKQIFVWWISVASLFLFIPLGIFFYIKDSIDPIYLLIPFAAGFIHCSYWIFYSHAYDHGDLSQVYPIIRSTPLLVLLFGVLFLNEEVSNVGMFGIFLMSFGVYAMNLKSLSFKEAFKPFLGIFADIHIQFAFLALLTTVAYSLVDKVGVSHMNPFTYAAVQCGVASCLFSLYLVYKRKWSLLYPFWRQNRTFLLTTCSLTSLNYPIFLFAMTLSQVSYVMSLRQISVVLVVLVGGHFLKESHLAFRLSGSILIFSGALLISLA